jgi:hypothetical protein
MAPKRKSRPQLRAIVRTAAGVLLLLWFISGHCIAADANLEYEVKAAFLLNFTKFTEWPPTAFSDSQSGIAVCILGSDPFGHVLDDIVQGEIVNGRKLTVRRISQPPAPQTCQVLFVEQGFKDPAKTLGSLPHGVLTVGEGDRFLRDGGMIAFVIDNRRVRFDINPAAAENGELKLSSKLLSVARAVANR